MEILKIEGGHKLSGTIEIGGAKNSAVALIPAAILSDETIIENVPEISDVRNLEEIITYLGAEFYKEGSKITINAKKLKNKEITQDHCKKLRASYYFMGALLGRFKKVEMYFPGGCPIGRRPIDFHLKAFEKLGAKVKVEGEKYEVEASNLQGAEIELPFSSVGATINILLAAVKAEGTTTIKNAAIEPEISNLVDYLNSMGAKIKGKDTNILQIEGVKKLTGGKITVIPDRIEAGTYIIAGALKGNNLKITNIIPNHIKALLDILKEIGVKMEIKDTEIIISEAKELKPANIKTETYPGFPTDLQQPITTLLATANGLSTIEETIYENRFQNIQYLNKMGTKIEINGRKIKIQGPSIYTPQEVVATDLRAGASLILAALVANGTTTITEVRHVLRGYENIIKKLKNIGAKITLEYL